VDRWFSRVGHHIVDVDLLVGFQRPSSSTVTGRNQFSVRDTDDVNLESRISPAVRRLDLRARRSGASSRSQPGLLGRRQPNSRFQPDPRMLGEGEHGVCAASLPSPAKPRLMMLTAQISR
jgi:hypothetical protein